MEAHQGAQLTLLFCISWLTRLNETEQLKKWVMTGKLFGTWKTTRNLERVCGGGQGAQAGIGRIRFTAVRKQEFSLEALFKSFAA